MIIKITRTEASVLHWAIDAMEDYWGRGGEAEREGLKKGRIPRVLGDTLALSDSDDVNADLRYRVGYQWYDVGGTAPEISGQQRAGNRLLSRNLNAKLAAAGVPDSLEIDP